MLVLLDMAPFCVTHRRRTDLLRLYPSFVSFLLPIEFSKSKSVVIPVVVRSVAGIVGSNTDEGMDVRVLCLLCVV